MTTNTLIQQNSLFDQLHLQFTDTNKHLFRNVEYLSFHLRQLVKSIIEGEMTLTPQQRNHVWSTEKSSDFILSYLQEPSSLRLVQDIVIITDGVRQMIVDGQQRISSFILFLLGSNYVYETIRSRRTLRDILQESQQETPNYKLLNIDLTKGALKLKFSKDYHPDSDFKNLLQGKYCSELPPEFQTSIFNSTIRVKNVTVTPIEFEAAIKIGYKNVNNGEPLSNEEKMKNELTGLYSYDKFIEFVNSDLFKQNFDFNDKRLKTVNVIIDAFSLFVGEYTGGHALQRRELLCKYAHEPETIDFYIQRTTQLLEMAQNLWPKGRTFSCLNEKDDWSKPTLASVIVWLSALEQSFKTSASMDSGYTSQKWIQHSSIILEEWKKVSIPSGKNQKDILVRSHVNAHWVDSITDHANNFEKVKNRINIIRNLFSFIIE